MQNLLDAEQVARILGVKSSTVYMLARTNQIPSVKIGGSVRFDPSEIEAYIESRKRKPKDRQ